MRQQPSTAAAAAAAAAGGRGGEGLSGRDMRCTYTAAHSLNGLSFIPARRIPPAFDSSAAAAVSRQQHPRAFYHHLCTDTETYPFFKCDCGDFFSGSNCEIPTNPCTSVVNPCGHGTCSFAPGRGSGTVTCTCDEDWKVAAGAGVVISKWGDSEVVLNPPCTVQRGIRKLRGLPQETQNHRSSPESRACVKTGAAAVAAASVHAAAAITAAATNAIAHAAAATAAAATRPAAGAVLLRRRRAASHRPDSVAAAVAAAAAAVGVGVAVAATAAVVAAAAEAAAAAVIGALADSAGTIVLLSPICPSAFLFRTRMRLPHI
ncbi:hypothetical protein Emed_001226 [Eimeria media]